MRDINRTLELWGAWAASDNSGVDYSHIAAGFKGLLPQSKGREQCCDDDGILIDSCVARLKEYSQQEYELLIRHYVYRVSARALARKLKCSDRTVRGKLQIACAFVNGQLCWLIEKLECEI